MPPAYVLRNISDFMPKFISEVNNRRFYLKKIYLVLYLQNPDERKQADKEWKNINDRLRVCLRQAAEICLQQGKITEKDYDEFFISSKNTFIRLFIDISIDF
jgi:hypothetical protein